jgi:hypothetical protein
MHSERALPAIRRISEGDIRAVLGAQGIDAADEQVAEMLDSAKRLDDAIAGLLEVGDLVLADVAHAGRDASEADQQAMKSVIARVLEQIDALLVVRAGVLALGMPLDADALQLMKVAQVTAAAMREAAL